MEIKEFKVGQRVTLIDDSRRNSNKTKKFATITRIGRKFVYAVEEGYSRDNAYRVRNDYEPYLVENIDYGTPIMLFPTEKAADEYIEREELMNWFISASNWMRCKDYTLAQLREVKKILEGGGKIYDKN